MHILTFTTESQITEGLFLVYLLHQELLPVGRARICKYCCFKNTHSSQRCVDSSWMDCSHI